MQKVKIGNVVKLKPSNRQMNKLDYNSRYIVTKTVPAESYTDDTQLITQVVDQFGNPINLKIVENMFDIIVPEVKVKRYSIGDKVISTRDTPQVPEGFVGYVVEKPSNSCNDYEYAVDSLGQIEYFNEEELELLSANIMNMKVPLSSYDLGPEALKVTPNNINGIKTSALDKQVSGSHYKDCGIQPIEYIHANSLSYFQGNVVKYVTRYKDKAGKADLLKAIHYLELMIELEYPDE